MQYAADLCAYELTICAYEQIKNMSLKQAEVMPLEESAKTCLCILWRQIPLGKIARFGHNNFAIHFQSSNGLGRSTVGMKAEPNKKGNRGGSQFFCIAECREYLP